MAKLNPQRRAAAAVALTAAQPAEAPAPIGHNRPKLDLLTRVELIEDHADLQVRVDDVRKRAGETTIPQALNDLSSEEIAAKIEVFSAMQQEVNTLLLDVDKKREEIKRPYFDITKVIDGFFNAGMRDSLTPAKNRLASDGGRLLGEKATRERLAREAAAKAAQEAADKRAAEAAKLEAAGKHRDADLAFRQAEAHEEMADVAATRAAAPDRELARTHTASGTAFTRTTESITIDRAAVDLEALRPFIDIEALKVAVRAHRKANGKAAIKGVTVEDVPMMGGRR